MIQGVIFDLGHTLIHLTEDHETVTRTGAEAMAEWYFKKKRIKLDQTRLVETFLRERAAAWQAGEQSHQETPLIVTLEKSLDAIEAPPTAKNKTLMEMAIKIYFEPEQSAWRAYPDCIDSLRALKRQGLRLGLYANATDDPFVQRLINDNKLRPELSATFSSAGKGWRKPKPDGFQLIARRWQLPAEAIVVVGDTLNTDILGAENAGMKSVLVTRHDAPSNRDQAHIKPTAVADSLSTLPEIIARL